MRSSSRARRFAAVVLTSCALNFTSFGIIATASAQGTTPAQTAPDSSMSNSGGNTPATTSAQPATTTPSNSQPVHHHTIKHHTQPSGLYAHIIVIGTVQTWRPTRQHFGLVPKSGGGYSLDTSKATAYLHSLRSQVDHGVLYSRIDTSNLPDGGVGVTSSNYPVPVKVSAPAGSATLDIPATLAGIQSHLAENSNSNTFHLVVKTTAPPASSDKYAGINARLAHFVTHFNPGERGRTQTVRLAISLVNGHVVQPGQTFSLNQTVGERTPQRGFGEGIVFINGKLDKQTGGGMCQVATTLFNAVLLANLTVVERHQHVRTIPYAKPGQDATVYWGQKDFKFKNDTDTPIYIVYHTTATHAICDLFGKADPSVKVRVEDSYRHLGPRHYTAVLRRYVTKNGKTSVNYTAYSAYKWTPSLDYNM